MVTLIVPRARAGHMTRIAICAPATPIDREVAAAVTELAAREFPGLVLAFHEQCFSEDGHFAGHDGERLAALLDCATDAATEAVWFAKGGYGSNRIALDAVEELKGRSLSMPFFGYSDCGYLHAAFARHGIGRAVHGPMPVDMRRAGGAEAVRRTLGWFAGDSEGVERSARGGNPVVAFNLTTLAMVCGTPLMPDLAGAAVMVEEVGEHLYAIDRLFFHVTAHLQGAAGLRVGRFGAVPENDRPFGLEPIDIARHWCEKSGIPFLGSADIGHDAANRIVPFTLAAAPARS